MNKDKYVFAQLVEFLDNNKFRHLVDKYDGNRYVKNFTCWNQLMALMFGQLCNRESLRDVVVALETHQSKCYHLGMGRNPIAKTTFATANQNRDYRIFEDFAFFMMEQARKKRATDIFKLVQLSYLKKKEQQEIIDAMEATQCTPSLSQSIRIKKLSEAGKLTESEAEGILGEIKQKEADRVVFKNEQLYRSHTIAVEIG